MRAAGGQFIVRIEDLDRGRVRPHFLHNQLEDLRWLGLDWDEGPDTGGPMGPYFQSERDDLYRQALENLARTGHLYECHCSRREILAAASAPHAADDEGPAYPGTCRDRVVTDPNTPGALRFRVPEGSVHFIDLLQGPQRFEPASETGDFVVRRKDGIAAYQLAVVVDDAAMGITDVLRGSDLLSSTARQILVYSALGLQSPRWTHVPLLLHATGERLAKRDGALMIRSLRERGCPPERVVGWLAHSCGLLDAPRETTPAELVPSFDPERIKRENTATEFPAWMLGG